MREVSSAEESILKSSHCLYIVDDLSRVFSSSDSSSISSSELCYTLTKFGKLTWKIA